MRFQTVPSRFLVLALAVVLPVLINGTAPRACAQGIFTGTISGTVQDASGSVVPNATITATNPATGITLTGVSDASGNFKLASVPVGIYSITVKAAGFEAKKLANVVVNAGKDAGLGAEQLKVGNASETVEVTASENILETTQAQITSTFDTQVMQNMPTGGGLDEVVLLIPGVASARGNRFGNTNGAAIVSNGQRERSDNFEIDGQSNNDNSVTGPQFFFSNADAVQEVEVITNQMGAQYGRDAGVVVNYVLKSGTNQYHGTVFEQYAGSFLSSLTQGQKQGGLKRPPRFVDNFFGGTFGFPILKDKLFGFVGVEFQRNFSGSNVSLSGSPTATTGYLPTQNGLKALQALYPNNPGVQALSALFPYNVGQGVISPLAGTTPKHILNQVSDGTTVMPDLEVQKYQRAYAPYSTDEELLGRVDYVMSNRDRFYLRYMYQNNPTYFGSGTVSTGGYVNVYGITHSVGATWTHYFTPQFANDLRWSFQQSAILFQGGGFPNCTTKNFSTCPTSLGTTTATAFRLNPSDGSAAIALGSTGLSTSYPQGRTVKTNQAQDNVAWTRGKQSIYFGGSYEFQNSPNVFLPNISGGYSLNGWNGLLQGTGSLGLAVGNPVIPFTEPDASLYFQDDWKVTPDLTLNLGIRWEFFAQSINLLHNITVANQTGPNPLWSTSLPLSQTTFPYVPPYYKNFEPRIGFAYNPPSLKGLVVRGGYAINSQPAYYNIFLNSYGSAPVVLSNTITNCGNAIKPCIPSGGANYSTVHSFANHYLFGANNNPGSFSQTLVNSSFRPPRVQSYNLGIQYAINSFLVGEARYVNVHTSAEFQSLNANPAIGSAAKQFPQFFGNAAYCTDTTAVGYNGGNGRSSCAAGNIRLRANTSFIVYNGLQTSLRTRNYHGVTADLSWTWSRAIDNASEIFGTLGGGTTVAFAQNPLETNVAERGRSGNSYPQVTSLGFTWVEPWFSKGNSLQSKLLGGYQFNTIYTFNSAQAYTPYQLLEGSYCDSSFAAAFNSSVDTCRPILANPSAPLGTVGYNAGGGVYKDVATGNAVSRSSEHWLLNTQAEAKSIGNPYPGVSRNTLTGDSWNNPDVSIFKSTRLTERLNLQLQLLIYNPLNRGYYGAPDVAVEDAGSTFGNFTGNAGSAFGVGTGARNVQLGTKILF
jgi:hypothetical protein